MKKILAIIMVVMLTLGTMIFLTSCDGVVIQGFQGGQGIQGIQGEKGEKGEKGDQGEKGEKGDPADGVHEWDFAYTLKPATCKEGGMELFSCLDCGLVKLVNTDPGDHTYGDWIVDKAATGKEEGLRHVECTACGVRGAEEIIPKLPYSDYTLGMGVVVDMNSSRDGNAQVDVTFAAVVLDDEGKIVSCRIDAAQNKMDITDGSVDPYKTFKTKKELGDDYNMAKFGSGIDNNGDGIVLEWYEQAEAFEKYVVGMTADEVEAMETRVTESGYVIAADEDLLNAGCTIQITDFINAVVKACRDDQSMDFRASDFSFGIAAISTANESRAATTGSDGNVAMYSDFAAVVLDGEGNIVAALNDAIQPKITMNYYGEIVSTSFNGTKRELKEKYNLAMALNYGMDGDGDGRVLEWYLQSKAFSSHVVGMTPEEVANMETAANSIGYQMTTDGDLLSAGCTIQITGLKEIVAKAAENAYSDVVVDMPPLVVNPNESPLNSVFPGGTDFYLMDISHFDLAYGVVNVYCESEGLGYVFHLNVSGYNPNMEILVGIDKEGKITGSKCIATQDNYNKEIQFDNRYNGQSYESFDPYMISGATYTSMGYNEAIKLAFETFEIIK